MDTIKEFLSKIFSNKRQVITVLVLGIIALSIPVGLQLSQRQQTVRSRASGAEDGKYVTINGIKSLAEMRAELKTAGWPVDSVKGNDILHLYNRNRNNIGGNSFNCVVNSGDLNNMPTTLETPFVGEEIPITIVMKLEQKACNTWFVNPRITNTTTGKVYGDWHPVGTGDETHSLHSCRNGRNAFIPPAGSAHYEYEGAGRYDQDEGNTHPQSIKEGDNWTTAGDAPLKQTSDCFFGIDSPGHYKVEIALGAREDAKSKGAAEGCNLPPDRNHEGVGLYYSCEFDAVAARGQTPGGGGGGGGVTPTPVPSGGGGTSGGFSNYPVSGHVKNASGSPVSGVTVEVSNGLGNKVSLQTDSSGLFTTPDFIKQGAGAGLDLYAVRIPDGQGKAVGGDNTLVHAPQGSFDTASGTASYEFQLAGSSDCAGLGNNSQSGRCDFTYSGSGGGGGTPTSTPVSSGQGGGTPTSSPTSNPASSITTDSVRIVEMDRPAVQGTAATSGDEVNAIWDNKNIVIEKKYSDVTSQTVPFTFRDTTCVTQPCDTFPNKDRWVWVLFIGHDSAGNVLKKVESKSIYVALPPKINSVNCSVSSSGGTTVTVNGIHFGQSSGSINLAGQNAPTPVTPWDNLSVTTTIPTTLSNGSGKVTLTTPEGQSDTASCTLGQSQIDFTASLACRSVSKALTTASVEVKDASSSASIFKQDSLSFDNKGRPQGLLPNPGLIEGKNYTLSIFAPNSLRKVIPFTAKKGTTVLQALDLPLGDIAPERPDCSINSLDISRLYSEWASNSDATNRRGDLNQDGRVNSLDYACMRSNFNQSCDNIP